MPKSSNHAKAPICAAFVEEFRRVFGEDQVIVLYVKENGFEYDSGKTSQDPKRNP